MVSNLWGNLLVGQCSTEVLLDVGFQHRVKVLKLSVSNQTNDVYLADRNRKRDSVIYFHSSRSYIQSSDRRVYLSQVCRHRDVTLDTDSLSSNQVHLVTRHTSICCVNRQTHTYQGIKHQYVIVVSLRMLHHNVEQGIQSVLQKLHTCKTKESLSERAQVCVVCTLLHAQPRIHTTDLDHLLSVNDFQFLQVFSEELRSSPPLEQPQEAH